MNAQLYMLQYVQTLKYYVTNHKSLLGGYLYMHSLVRNLIAWWLLSFKWTDRVARHQAARLGYLELEPTFYEHGRLSYLVGRRNVRNVSQERQEKKYLDCNNGCSVNSYRLLRRVEKQPLGLSYLYFC